MKRVLIGLLLITLSFSAKSHDVKMAMYKIYIEEGQLVCDSKIDMEDFKNVLGDNISVDAMKQYIHNHLIFTFDSTEVSYKLLSHEFSKDWVSIRFELKTTNHTPTDIQVLNTILSEDKETHDNVMRFLLHGQTRNFRLNDKRKNVSFNY